jgi:hypothetical protein
MLGILGALADPRKDPLVDREPRLDTQRFGGLLGWALSFMRLRRSLRSHRALREPVGLRPALLAGSKLGHVLIKREMSASEAKADMRWSPRNFAF